MRKKIIAAVIALAAIGGATTPGLIMTGSVSAAPSLHAVSNGTWHFE